MDYYGFYTGKIFDAYKYLGAHIQEDGTVFRTFAPAASRITVIGEFNNWQEWDMNRIADGNFWELTVPGAKKGMMYKYCIYDRFSNRAEHCDPYGFGMELRPGFASIIRDPKIYSFQDQAWMHQRSDCRKGPLNIYEIHFGSFRKPGESADSWYTYEEMADILIPYLKKNHYNYLEIMPLNEYPCDDSWGYQATGFFSPTSRYGTNDQLKYFVDSCHKNEIGVIMDFVPVHFALDGYALAQYDGTSLYEYPNSAVGVSEWGSCNFMHSRGEVRSFLQSAANYWLSEFHMDGLRMDAIIRAIYWQGDPARGVNGSAVEFLQYMNKGLKELHPSAILAAEDSTSFPKVTDPVSQGGLGFDYKWDMGWMNDTLDYFRTAPEYRSRDYHRLTFSMMYYYDARFLLPLSHDEVVHGKATILQKMNGDYDGKFPQGRAFYMYMYAHPGKKLNFMGNEFGQLREWDEKREQDWMLLDYPIHSGFARFMKDLNQIYLQHSAFWEKDYEADGFQWIDCHQEEHCVYIMKRSSTEETILAAFNFSDKDLDYELRLPGYKKIQELLSSNMEIYGGSQKRRHPAKKLTEASTKISLPAFSAVYYTIE